MKILFLIAAIWAGPKAHHHGHAEVSIAFDGNNGKIELIASGDSIFGFEHVAKSEKDKKAQTEALSKLENNISAMIEFDATLSCVLTKESMQIEQDKNHSEVKAGFQIKCLANPEGKKITFNFQKVFPSLRVVDVQVLTQNLQKSTKVKKDGAILDLK